jgi:hypothetical protein
MRKVEKHGSCKTEQIVTADSFQIVVFPKREPMRLPKFKTSKYYMGDKLQPRNNGQKAKYKSVRRGLGRPTINIMLF